MTDLEQAWAQLLESAPASWYVGTPVYHVERDQWALYAFDTTRAGEDRQEEPGMDGRRADRGRRRA